MVKMYVLGINCYYHDSAACLIKDGKVIAAAEEERFTREKHTNKFPVHAIDYCLREAGISFSEISHIGFFWNPWIRLRKGMSILLRYFPKSITAFRDANTGFNMMRVKNEIKNNFRTSNFKFYYIEHHLAHAASCFFVSPFKEAAILSIDGTGESTTTLLAIGRENKIKVLKRIKFPHSIGLVYNAVTEFLGFKRDSDEWKVMGLAPYGKPAYYNEFKRLIKLKPDGSFKLDLSYFKFQYGGEPYYSKKFVKVFGQPRKEDDPIEKRHEDIAHSLQLVTEEAILHIVKYLQKATNQKKLCLAGGVALNSVANGRIITETKFRDIFVQPAANDAGTSLGSAFYIYNQILKNPRSYIMHDAYLGPEYSEREIEAELKKNNLDYIKSDNITKDAAKLLSEGKIVGWFQDRMEFGPRALGNRSILADPRKAEMKDIINAKVKYRESFRPFAPSVLEEYTSEYFEHDYPSPFMLLVYKIKKNKQKLIPAVTHADGTGRLQTVNKKINPLYWNLIDEFRKLTNIPVILNTSFNIKGEPIVCSPKDAINCFKNTGIDCLAIGPFLVKQKL